MKKKDIYLFSSVIIIIILSSLLAFFFVKKEDTNKSYVLIKNEYGEKKYPLGEERDVTIKGKNGDVNVIHIGKNGFYMKSSNCPHHECIGQGKVDFKNMDTRFLKNKVICLPHKLVITLVKGKNDESK